MMMMMMITKIMIMIKANSVFVRREVRILAGGIPNSH
jgi:hypothetical protein